MNLFKKTFNRVFKRSRHVNIDMETSGTITIDTETGECFTVDMDDFESFKKIRENGIKCVGELSHKNRTDDKIHTCPNYDGPEFNDMPQDLKDMYKFYDASYPVITLSKKIFEK